MTHPSRRAALFALCTASCIMGLVGAVSARLVPEGEAPPDALLFRPNLETNRQDPALFPLRLRLVGDVPASFDVDVLEDALEYAAATWTAVGCSSVELVYAGRTDALEEPGPSDVLVTIDSSFFGPANPDDFAIAAAGGAQGAGFVVINPDKALTRFPDPAFWRGDGLLTTPDVAMARAVLLHEVGHVLALQHPNADPSAPETSRPLSTMHGVYASDGGQATLSADDRAALCALYPNDTPETCREDAECVDSLGQIGATCITLDLAAECAAVGSACDGIEGEVTVCEEPRTPFGARCFVEDDTCPEVCLYDDLARGQGLCTRRCDGGSECPEGFGCTVTSGDDVEPPLQHCLPTAAGSIEPRDCGCASVAPRAPRAPWLLIAAVFAALFIPRRITRALPEHV